MSVIYIVFVSGQSKFVVKVNGQPSEKYWMGMMKSWLNSVQLHYDRAMSAGKIDNVTGLIAKGVKLNEEARIARRLICSFGNNYNCTGRVCHVLLLCEPPPSLCYRRLITFPTFV
jgi:hypothetical protein